MILSHNKSDETTSEGLAIEAQPYFNTRLAYYL